jgi:hypothetical protein
VPVRGPHEVARDWFLCEWIGFFGVDGMAVNLIAGRVYGMGDRRTALSSHFDVQYDHEQGVNMLVDRKTKARVREDEVEFPKFVVLLNDDLSEASDAGEEMGVDAFIDHCESKILLHRGELQSIESRLCDRLGCSVGDGSELADEVFCFVHNPDKSSQHALLDAYNRAAVARDEDPVEV